MGAQLQIILWLSKTETFIKTIYTMVKSTIRYYQQRTGEFHIAQQVLIK